MIPKITEGNFEQHIHDYTVAAYGDTVAEWSGDCPYSLDFGNDLFSYKQFITWFSFKRVRPETGDTILDEFVGRFVDDKKLAARILQIKRLFHDTFHVLETNGKKINIIGDNCEIRRYRVITARAHGRRKIFSIMATKKTADLYEPGTVFTGLIHPWLENGTHRTCGILSVIKFPGSGKIRFP